MAKKQNMSFEQRVIIAERGMDNGEPLQDYLDDDEIERAIEMLADIFNITGVRIPEDCV